MPRAHPTAIRHQILGLQSQGLSLVQIASQLLLPYTKSGKFTAPPVPRIVSIGQDRLGVGITPGA